MVDSVVLKMYFIKCKTKKFFHMNPAQQTWFDSNIIYSLNRIPEKASCHQMKLKYTVIVTLTLIYTFSL